MSSAVSRLIKNLPLASLEAYFRTVHSKAVEDLDWEEDASSIKKALLEITENIDGETLALLTSDAERMDSLTDELGQNILNHFVADNELEQYFALENEYDRVLWLFLKDTVRFSQVEDSWYTDTKRQGRMWEAFVGPEKASISADIQHVEEFKAKLMELFRAVGNIKVDVYERARTDGEENEVEIIQIMVY